ncbi:hypothetical protein ACQ4PT_045755 [Festuca glaucescens]
MDAACESCALWRDHCYWDHRKDEKKPQFSVVAPNDFKNSVAFCKEYASAYLPSRDQTLTLQLEDKEWDTTLHVRPNSKAIHGGWSDFAIDNDLRLGDICLFAKRGIRSLVMRIHFVRKLGILL